MIKKGSIITVIIITAVCFASACASRTSKSSDWQVTEQSQIIDSEEEDNHMEDISVGVGIDYVIESYESVQKFGYDLLAQSIDDENPILSPVSAYLALSMAGCGANGTTKDEFYRVLGNDMMSLSDDMMNTLPTKGDVLNLSIANSAWIDDAFIVDDIWLGTIHSLMDAEAFAVDISTEKTMKEINHWIEDRTNGLIDKILAEPLNTRTRLALFNTVYFKGKWEIPFDAFNTQKEDFYLHKDQNETKQTDMMNLYEKDLDYIANDYAEGVILPYQKNDSDGENLAFIALKPIDNSNVRDVYSKLTTEVITNLLADKQTCLVNLKLPKFAITFDKKLNDSLSNMGLLECFNAQKANFNQMGQTQSGDNLYISLVQQKAKIIVDEEGTEAAAVTAVIMACGAAMIDPQESKELYFNEPFIYMIMDMDKELPVFVGILDNPVS